jgi:hypothetical protein
LLALAAAVPRLPARTWYVDASARAAPSDGLSPATAWKTLADIRQDRLRGGDVVRIAPGIYREVFVITRSGASAKARITYKGIGLPLLYGINGAGPTGKLAYDYIAVIGLRFTQPDPSYAESSHTVAGIGLRGAKGWLIQDNAFIGMYGPPIDLHYGTSNRYNIIREASAIIRRATPSATTSWPCTGTIT